MVRLFVKEPERWKKVAAGGHARIAELFTPQYIKLTISGFCMAVTALIMWWSCNAFIPVVAKGLASREATQILGLDPSATEALGQQWVKTATNSFNLGGLIGTLLTIPIAKILGRKKMFFIYYLTAAASIMFAFGLNLAPHTRLYMYFPIGLDGFRCVWQLYILSARAVSDAFTGDRCRIYVQHRTSDRRRRSVCCRQHSGRRGQTLWILQCTSCFGLG